MAYATAEDFRSSLGESQYKAIYKGDDSLAEHDLLLASAEIDGYLAKRYTVPVTSAGAAYFRQASGDLPEKVKLRAEEIRKILRDFSTGAALLAADAVPQQKGQSGLLDIVCDEKRFSRDTMRGY